MSFQVPTPETINSMSRDELRSSLNKACDEIRKLHLKSDCDRLSGKLRVVPLEGKIS